MVCTSADNADLDPVTLIPTCETIDDIDAASCVEVVDGTFAVDTPDLSNDISLAIIVLQLPFKPMPFIFFKPIWPEDAGQRGTLGSEKRA